MNEARAFFAHESQQKFSAVTPDTLPDEGFEYWASGPVCGVFHRMPWPDVWAGHYGVVPSGWGRATAPARAILEAFWDARGCARIVGWTPESNRAALAFARRLGFVIDGAMPTTEGTVIMQGWQK